MLFEHKGAFKNVVLILDMLLVVGDWDKISIPVMLF